MNDLDIIRHALAQTRIKGWKVSSFVLSDEAQNRLALVSHKYGLEYASPATEQLTLFGYPVKIDPSLKPGEIRIESGDTVMRVVNLGE